MDVKLPKLGEGAESGVVVNLAVSEGDSIAKGQTILELENEKAVAAIPSPAAGVVGKIRVKVGDRIGIGQVILTLAGSEAPPEAASAPAAPKPAVRPPPAAPRPGAARAGASARQEAHPSQPAQPAHPAHADKSEPSAQLPASDGAAQRAGLPPPASPSVRRLAREIGLDLSKVPGSEAGGRITLGDIRDYIAALERRAEASARNVSSARAAAAASAEAAPQPESIDFAQWGPVTKKPLAPIRVTISRRMLESKNSIPHVTQFEEIDITQLTELRKQHAPAYEAKGTRLTLTSFALQAVAETLKKFPLFNSSLDEGAGEIVFKNYCHIGLAVDTEQGLLVPVIRNADQKNLLQLSQEVQAFADKARARKISLEEMKGGTFTISNQGGIGGAHFTPIINKPEVAILGLGRASLKPVVTAGQKIEARLLMPIGLSYDHRVIDGGEAARFVVALAQEFGRFTAGQVKL